MSLLVISLHYLWWHYTLAWRDLFSIYRNFLWFVWHFFSVGPLFSTLLSPWRRLGEEYRGGFDLGAIVSVWLVNILMRSVGFIFRSLMIVFALAAWLLVFAAGLVFIFLWPFLPLAAAALLLMGVYFLFR